VFSLFALFSATSPSLRINEVVAHVSRLQDFVSRVLKLDLNQQEFAYLKAIVLFSPGKRT